MKVRNVTGYSIVLGDVLVDSVPQYQMGVKNVTIPPCDDFDIPNAIASESLALKAELANGNLVIKDNTDKLGGNGIFGQVAGLGVVAFNGVVKTNRDESGAKFRFMFGTPEVGDEIVDQQIHGFDVAATADVLVVDHGEISGTVTIAKATAAASGNVIVTLSGAALTDQNAITMYAKLLA
jgi:hypothetical protein